MPLEKTDLFMWLSGFSPGEMAELLKTGLPILLIVIFVIVIGGTTLWLGIGNQLLGRK